MSGHGDRCRARRGRARGRAPRVVRRRAPSCGSSTTPSSAGNAAGGANAPVVLSSAVDGTVVEFAGDGRTLGEGVPIDRSGGVVWSPDGRWLLTVTGADRVSAWRQGPAKPITIVLPSTYPMDALAGALP